MKLLYISILAALVRGIASAEQPSEADILRAFSVPSATYRLKPHERPPKNGKAPLVPYAWLLSYDVRGEPEPLLEVGVALLTRPLFSEAKALERFKQVDPDLFRAIDLPSGRRLFHVCFDRGSGGTSIAALIYDPATQRELWVSATQRWSEDNRPPVFTVREICVPAAKALEPIVFSQ